MAFVPLNGILLVFAQASWLAAGYSVSLELSCLFGGDSGWQQLCFYSLFIHLQLLGSYLLERSNWSLVVMSLSRLYLHGIEFIFEKGQGIGFACITELYANWPENWLRLFAGSLKLNAPSCSFCSEVQSGERPTQERKIVASFPDGIVGVQGTGQIVFKINLQNSRAKKAGTMKHQSFPVCHDPIVWDCRRESFRSRS